MQILPVAQINPLQNVFFHHSARIFAYKQHCGSQSGKTAWDMGKTTSYAGKIMSDIIQTTSDLFSAVANLWETVSYGMISKTGKLL